MNNHEILESSSIVWYYHTYQGVFSVLETLRKKSEKLYLLCEANTEETEPWFFSGYPEIVEYFRETYERILPDAPPEYKILKEYPVDIYLKYFLIEGIDLSASHAIAQAINNAIIIIFSNNPGVSWIEKFIKADKEADGRSIENAFLAKQTEIIERFEFSLFGILPDWDCDNNTLIVSKNTKLLEELSSNTENRNVWRALKMNMFPEMMPREKYAGSKDELRKA
ncbi:MAG: hypothetical protein LBS40_05750 [Burkholderiales bacterium]|jgi:hypothetical protein|nr:hypothetical protein [Burkholderiales bacterium]